MIYLKLSAHAWQTMDQWIIVADIIKDGLWTQGINKLYVVHQESPNFSIKDEIVNILGFSGNTIYVVATWFCPCRGKHMPTIMSKWVLLCTSLFTKAGGIWPTGHSLQTPGLHS